MNKNPEFLRNLWLEFTPYRLAGMPLVLCAIFLLVYLVSNEPAQALSNTSLTLFTVIVLLWGTRLASETVVAEIRDRTWDIQRMSDIGPWSMTWGKLLGSTIYPWYGGLLCLLAYAVLPTYDPALSTARTIALYVSAGLFGNAAALLSSMQAIKKERRYNRSEAAAFLILGVLVASPIISLGVKPTNTIVWFGAPFPGKDFLLLSVSFFLFWTVYGIYRLMRTELQMKNGPLAWLAFSVFLIIYFAGFVSAGDPRERLFGIFSTGFILSLVLTYLMAFSERKDPVAFRRLLIVYRRRDWTRVLQEVPSWAITLLPLLICGCGLLLTGLPPTDAATASPAFRMSIMASFLFIARDLGLLLFFNLASNARRADWIMVLSLGLLYGVVPGIMNALNLEAATVLFWPRWDIQSPLGLIGPLLEALLVILLLVRRWKSQYDK